MQRGYTTIKVVCKHARRLVALVQRAKCCLMIVSVCLISTLNRLMDAVSASRSRFYTFKLFGKKHKQEKEQTRHSTLQTDPTNKLDEGNEEVE